MNTEMTIAPDYYNGLCGLTVDDAIDSFELNFRLGNVLKYIVRAGKKGPRSDDLKKAMRYLELEIERAEALEE